MAEESPTIPPSDLAKLLFEYTKENDTFIRHYEEIRFKISQVTVTLAGLLIGATRLVSATPQVSSQLPLSAFIVFLGLIGIVISVKYSERADRHAAIARAYRRAASDIVDRAANINFEALHQAAAEKHAKRAVFVSRIQARYFWYLIHACVVILGLLVGYL